MGGVAYAFYFRKPGRGRCNDFGKDPNLEIRFPASGLTSRCGMARKSTSSSNS